MGTLLNKSGKGQYQLLTSPWSLHFKGFSLFFPAPFFFFFLTSPAGRRACPVCVKLVSLNANAMSLGGNFVVLHKGTSKSYHKSVHREIPGELGLGVWLHTHTQEKLWCSSGFAHAKWHTRCLTAWESVNIKPHNQWGPFKVLEMASDKCHFLSMSRLSVCCFQGRWHEEEFNWITLKTLTETFSVVSICVSDRATVTYMYRRKRNMAKGRLSCNWSNSQHLRICIFSLKAKKSACNDSGCGRNGFPSFRSWYDNSENE